jgi:hypothetical protein
VVFGEEEGSVLFDFSSEESQAIKFDPAMLLKLN